MSRRLSLLFIGSALSLLSGACGASGRHESNVRWTPVSDPGHVVTVAAIGAGWYLGGDTVDAAGTTHVAVWTGPVTTPGRWETVPMDPDPERDGPNETILGVTAATRGGPVVAFGSRFSPTEGYPRPSAWIQEDGRLKEVVADRELFGGPNVVAIGDDANGGLTSGVHGYHLAGTWIGPTGRVVAAVWSSPTGSDWERNDSDPAFSAGPGSVTYGASMADGPSGLLMVGTADLPDPQDPLRTIGEAWSSPDGSTWSRLSDIPLGVDRSSLGVVKAFATGWLAGGQSDGYPVVVTFPGSITSSSLSASPSASPEPPVAAGAQLLPIPKGSTARVIDLAIGADRAVAVGTDGAGRLLVWAAPVAGDRLIGPWSSEPTPPGGNEGWTQARVAISGSSLLLVADDTRRSRMWSASW